MDYISSFTYPTPAFSPSQNFGVFLLDTDGPFQRRTSVSDSQKNGSWGDSRLNWSAYDKLFKSDVLESEAYSSDKVNVEPCSINTWRGIHISFVVRLIQKLLEGYETHTGWNNVIGSAT